MPVSADIIKKLTKAEFWDPHSVLGPHEDTTRGQSQHVIRAFVPNAATVVVLPKGKHSAPLPMTQIKNTGLFETPCPPDVPDTGYRLRVTDSQGTTFERHDPYAFPPMLSDFDLHLFGEGNLYKAYDKLGAHVVDRNGVRGVNFAVWAPNANRVSVVGDFNQWDGRSYPMQSRGGTGIWELFIPDLGEWEKYKYEIRPRDSKVPLLKADPYATQGELRPHTASVIRDVSQYQWQDHAWMDRRVSRDCLSQPLSIYEVHLGSWRRVPEEGSRWLTYTELADQLVPYVKDLGLDRKSTRLNSSHTDISRMPSSA